MIRRIERLPEDIHGSVRSGVVISDFSRIVEELVFNSLEAGASKVFVAFGVSSCYIKVLDNGCGIARDDLVLVGERYATSKVCNRDLIDVGSEYLDFHGEALCSISDVSLLEIVTKSRGKPNGYKKILKNCRSLFFGVNDDRQDVGTTVTVRDIFYNQPVRRKHMESSPKKVLDSVKMSVLKIALVHVNVSFRLVDVESTGELLNIGPSPSPLPILASYYGIEKAGDLYELNTSDGAIRLSGYISGPLESLSLKGIQYVYINSRFICKGPIHKLLNQLAMKFELCNSWTPTAGSQRDKRNKWHIGPTFILNLTCPRSYYDTLTLERSRTSVEFKDWGPILTFIENEVMHIWDQSTPRVASEHGRKRCRKHNYHTSIDLHDVNMKLPNNYFNKPAWEESSSFQRKLPPFSQLKKLKDEKCILSNTDYLSQFYNHPCGGDRNTICEPHSSNIPSCFDFRPDHHRYTEYRSFDELSSSTLVDILPEYDKDMNKVFSDSGLSGDSCVNQDLKKSFLRGCSVQGSLLNKSTPPVNDEIFEFGNSDFRTSKRQVHYGDSFLDEVDLRFGGREMQSEGGHVFLNSPLTRHSERSEFLTEDLVKSPLVFRDVAPDFSQVLKCSSSQQSLSPGWSPDNDVLDKSLIESGSTYVEDAGNWFGTCAKDQDLMESILNTEDYTDKYTLRKNTYLGLNLSTEERYQQPTDSYMNSFPDHKGYTYLQTEIDEFCWDGSETSWSPVQCKKLGETDWSAIPIYDEERNKMPSLFGTSQALHECRGPDSKNHFNRTNIKKSFVRGHSAPPFYRGKKGFLDLSDSSAILSGKSNIRDVHTTNFSSEPSTSSHMELNPKSRKLKRSCSQKSIGQYDPYQMEITTEDCSFAKRPGFERTPEDLMNSSQKKDHKMEHVECIESDKVRGSSDQGMKEIQDPSSSGVKWRNYCSPIAGETMACINNGQHTILDISSDFLQFAGDSLIPKSIDKTSLEGAKVINQVDKKFIAVVAGKILAVIDQHAADERIRLEELRHKVLSGEMKSITYLDDEQELVLPEIGSQLLHNYTDQIKKWGWICNFQSEDANSFTKNLDCLHRQPTVVKLLAVPCILGVNLTDIDLLEFLQQLADTDGSSTVPPSVHNILNNKACRGAIMFGDKLLPSECSLIVEELNRTSLCFQCAHGRPTTVPLVNLDVLHNKVAKLCSDRSWHGLYQHELKLERMAQRLSSALS